ncbi:sigma-70 family RNA polymerase sigma factor [Pseudomonas serbica]|uniref:sigma-70 family RNA polymerase sigma factor n=1 Tax=Pseudomonas serbica TaxID=2965074 RepID=UPI00237ADD5C|nr:sigma-70 family RNA polymerase sigma factor [Pseudomonas serbica]
MNNPTTSQHPMSLWKGHLALATDVVKAYCFRQELREDAIQEVLLALWEAVQDWDAGMQETFTHYAWLFMRRKLLVYLTQKATDCPRLSRRELSVMKQIRVYLAAGHMITCQAMEELSQQSGITLYRLHQLVGFWYTSCVSLSAASFAQIADGYEDDIDVDEERRLEALDKALASLPEREMGVIRERHLTDPHKTLAELSVLMGISIERVRQIEANGIKKLKRALMEATA